jgi:DNA-binding transcriptional MerR regulator
MGGSYGTGDVERLLGLGEHVIRYWERELPILSPHRSPFGRRAWSEADIALLLRVRHLVKNRHLGLSATLDALIAERSGTGADSAAMCAEIRAALVLSYFESRALSERLSRMHTEVFNAIPERQAVM